MNEEMNRFMEDQEKNTQKSKFLTFYLGNECYGIDII